jgi:hypothetical protein
MKKENGRAGEAADENVIWHMCFACWITRATNPHSEYVILIVLYGNNG